MWKNAGSGSLTPSFLKTNDTMVIALRESPPNAKKSSSMPTASIPRTVLQISAICCCSPASVTRLLLPAVAGAASMVCAAASCSRITSTLMLLLSSINAGKSSAETITRFIWFSMIYRNTFTPCSVVIASASN
ncbi:hypothetical protein D3C75_1095820 [compost metagenome]